MAKAKRNGNGNGTNGHGPLDLDERPVRRLQVKLGGKLYGLRDPSETRLRDIARIEAMGERLAKLKGAVVGPVADEKAIADADGALLEMVTFLLPDVPRDELADLPDVQKIRVLNYFTSATKPGGAPLHESPSPQGSSDSTAATRRAG